MTRLRQETPKSDGETNSIENPPCGIQDCPGHYVDGVCNRCRIGQFLQGNRINLGDGASLARRHGDLSQIEGKTD